MLLLFKDYKTGKKSITVTMTVVSVTLLWFIIGVESCHRYNGQPADTGLIWATIPLVGMFFGALLNKRFRASKDGISIESETSPSQGEDSHG